MIGARVHEYKTLQGAKYSVLDLKDIIRMELANPIVAEKMTRFPVDTQGVVSELYQTPAWKSNPYLRVPCASVSNVTFWCGDIVNISDVESVIERFYVDKQNVRTDV